MKKFLQLITISMAAIVLVACGNQEEPAESVSEASVEQTSQASVESQPVSSVETGANSASESGEAANADESEEPTGEVVTVTLYVTGEAEPHAEFEVPYVEGMNVLATLEQQEDLDFNFNEDEGVVDMIDGIENDYDMGYTWSYVLNGAFAELGVVSQTIEAGDNIEWYYGTIDEIPAYEGLAEEEAVEEEFIDEAPVEEAPVEEPYEEEVVQ